MGMAKIVKTLLLERDMTLTDLAGKLGKTVQNMSAKLRRDNLSEKVAGYCQGVQRHICRRLYIERYEKGNKIVFRKQGIGRRLQRPNHISGP